MVLRALRRRADLSQRELAALAGVRQATVARIEAGRATDPKFRTVERLVLAAGGWIGLGAVRPGAAALEAASGPAVRIPHEEMRDEGGRHYPAHLDVREVRTPKDWAGAWWAHWYDLPPERWPLRVPAATYDLSRERRDRRRWLEEVRSSVRLRRVAADLPAGAWWWVAERPDGELVGELRAHQRGRHPADEHLPKHEVVLDGVVVAPDYRGLGIGRRLVAELAAEMERAAITLARAVAEFQGVDFLVACGFRIEAARPVKLTLVRGQAARGEG
jgi:ribosomal protein S18 acetylase RimI-like enzyme/DNA-binding XRE family transcriptional regulator